MTKSLVPTIAELRLALKEVGTGTSFDLVKRLRPELAASDQRMIAAKVSVALITASKGKSGKNDWVGRGPATKRADGKAGTPPTIWKYVEAKPPAPKPASSPIAQAVAPIAAPTALPITLDLRGFAEALVGKMLTDALDEQGRVLVGAFRFELEQLEKRLVERFGGGTTTTAPEVPAIEPEVTDVSIHAAPGKRQSLPKVLVYRLDKTKALELGKKFQGKLDLEIHTDLNGNGGHAKRYAQRKWDHVVFVTRHMGHDEREAFANNGAERHFITAGDVSVAWTLDKIVAKEAVA